MVPSVAGRFDRFRLTPPNLLAFVLGVCSVFMLRALPSPSIALACAGAGVVMATLLRGRCGAALAFAVAGWLWSAVVAAGAMAERLPAALEGEDLVATGYIADLPQQRADGWRFRFCPERVLHAGKPIEVRGCWRLGWYARPAPRGGAGRLDAPAPGPALPMLAPGARWQLTVRLRRPRGLSNPGGFDSERTALATGISAVGNVRDGVALVTGGEGIDALRGWFAERVDAVNPAQRRIAALLRGLAVGDRRGFEASDWHTLRQTGTTHLFAISGLHVGMVAIFVALLGAAAMRVAPSLLTLAPRRVWILPPALLAATAYAALAGFEVPTRRTLVMIAVGALAVIVRRHTGPWQAWCLALAGVLAADPLAALGAGFWLSFLGVAWLLLHAAGSSRRPWWRTALEAQWAVTLGLLPVGIAFFAQTSWLSPVANLVAIPWITFLVVPVLLFSLPFQLAWPTLGDLLVGLAGALLRPLIALLDAVAEWSWASAAFVSTSPLAIAFALLAAVVAIAPLHPLIRCLALPLALPMLFARVAVPQPGEADLHVLDVGQGTAIVVRTHRHTLLVDTGAAYPSGHDAGESVVLPALQALGISRLDRLLVSHADSDHAGGVASVLRAITVDEVLLGEPVPGVAGEPCREGARWQWDGVRFEVLHPPPRYPAHGNDASCVLALRAAGGSALLPGDAGEVAELRMMNLHAARLPSDVLVLGHHGSKTSSTPDFMDAVAPSLAIATAGYRNRFGHPHPDVLRRLRWRGVEVVETARSGAMHVRLAHDGVHATAYREQHRRFWHEP